MSKAKTLDRLELTRRKFKPNAERLNPSKSTPLDDTPGLSICPNCGEKTLRHEGACNICPYCGYSKCG